MATMFVKHHVSHYDSWRHVYDEFAPVRKARGVEKQKVYRSIDDPNDVTAPASIRNGKGRLRIRRKRRVEGRDAKRRSGRQPDDLVHRESGIVH